jgi:hypothetical protein
MTPEQMQSYAAHYNVPLPDLAETHFLYTYGYKPVESIIQWGWSSTFGRFNALVRFPDGTECWTYPRPEWSTQGR